MKSNLLNLPNFKNRFPKGFIDWQNNIQVLFWLILSPKCTGLL